MTAFEPASTEMLTEAWQTHTGHEPKTGGRLAVEHMAEGGWTLSHVEHVFALARHAIAHDGAVPRYLRRLHEQRGSEAWAQYHLEYVATYLVSRVGMLMRRGDVPLAEALDWVAVYAAATVWAFRTDFEDFVVEDSAWPTWTQITPPSLAVLGYLAGLTPDEVQTAADNSAVPVMEWQMLAALRGWLLSEGFAGAAEVERF